METLEIVLVRSARDLVHVVERRTGFSRESAERFVILAGTDLIESFKWQADALDPNDLSAPNNVRDLLSGIGGNRIASTLGMPPSEVWSGLREFVPSVLRLADGARVFEA
jgi:hypothetical protein